MASGPFHVVWETCDSEEWDNPAATWGRREDTFDMERDAVGLWQFLKGYVNTRPISIEPEPDWSNYTYDGHAPLTR